MVRSEYFKKGDRVCINDPTSKRYDPNVVCYIVDDQYHQWIKTDVYGYVNVTSCNVHPVVLDDDGYVNVAKTLAQR